LFDYYLKVLSKFEHAKRLLINFQPDPTVKSRVMLNIIKLVGSWFTQNSNFSCLILTQIISIIPLKSWGHFTIFFKYNSFIPFFISLHGLLLFHSNITDFFLIDICSIIVALFLCIIFSYRLPFITTLISWDNFIIFLILYYPPKLITDYANVMNFKLKIKILIFNLKIWQAQPGECPVFRD
jgi:hypothetical protein